MAKIAQMLLVLLTRINGSQRDDVQAVTLGTKSGQNISKCAHVSVTTVVLAPVLQLAPLESQELSLICSEPQLLLREPQYGPDH